MDNHYNGEWTIDLTDMVFYFLRKWKSLLVLFLICSVLGGFYGVAQTNATVQIDATTQVADYVPSNATLAKMEQAAQVRAHYEKALESGTEDFTVLNNGRALVDALEKAFSGDALTYYQVNYLGMDAPSTDIPDTAVSAASIIKPAVIGAFLGCVLWGVWRLLAYLLNPTIKTAEELSHSHGIILLGRVSTEKSTKGFSKLIANWQNKSKHPGITTAYLAAVIDTAQDGMTVLCGNTNDEAIQTLMNHLENASQKIKANGFISESETALKAAKEATGSVLVIHTWHTTRTQVMRELEMCRLQNVKILGTIVID